MKAHLAEELTSALMARFGRGPEVGRQFADVTISLFGALPPETVGWFEASSDSSDLTGFFLFLDFPDFAFFDGADLPRKSRSLVFPEVRLHDDFRTQISVVNPGSDDTLVQFKLLGGETPLVADDLAVPARGVVRLDVRDIFEGSAPAGILDNDEPFAVSLLARAPVVGFASVQQAATDLLGLNAVPEDELLNHLFFPQLAVGEIIRTELSLENLSTQQTLVTLTAHQEDGEPFPPGVISTNPVTRLVESGQVLRLDMAETFGFLGGEVRSGWLEVEATTEALLGALSYSLPGSGSRTAVATSRLGSRQAAFSHLDTAQGFFTGLALLNSAS